MIWGGQGKKARRSIVLFGEAEWCSPAVAGSRFSRSRQGAAGDAPKGHADLAASREGTLLCSLSYIYIHHQIVCIFLLPAFSFEVKLLVRLHNALGSTNKSFFVIGYPEAEVSGV